MDRFARLSRKIPRAISSLRSKSGVVLGNNRLFRNVRGGNIRSLGLFSGGRRELGLLGGSRSRLSRGRWGDTATAQHLLGLLRIVSSILLGDRGDVRGLLLSNAANLGSLGIDDVGGILELLVDDLLVRGVNKRNKEDHGSGDKSESPVWDNADKVVREEGSHGSLQNSS